VGRIGLVDFDVVDASNLQRQILYATADVGRPKLQAARERLEGINPHVRIEIHEERLLASNALRILSGYDVVADGTDNFAARYLVNDACVLLKKPNVFGSVFRFEGQVSVFWAGKGPCYRCLFPEPPPPGLVPSCAEAGVLGVLPGIVGTIQAAETIKLVLGAGELLLGRLLLFDALEMRFRELRLRRDPGCAACGDRPTLLELTDREISCESGAGAGDEISPSELNQRLRRGDDLLLLDVRTPAERAICRIEGSLHVPLDQLPRRLDEIDPAREVVVYCKIGGRSARAVTVLRERGQAAVRNLRGGLEAWAREVDPSLPRY
jgi:adenylyltransferase/sulfurtransferase